MKQIFCIISAVIAVTFLSACANQMRRGPEPIVQKPREVTLVYFDFNKSHLKSEEKAKLSPTIESLTKHPSWIAQLEGHADAIGAAPYNLRLGDKRARSVKEAMVLEGIAPEQLIILSFGEDKPVASNANDAGRSQNRRVEVKVR